MFSRHNGPRSFRTVRRLALLSLSALVLLAAPASAQLSIDTFPPVWDGAAFISSFGVTNTATYGQVIRVGADATPLRSFAFEIGNCTANVTMRGEVYAWDGTRATGSALYESSPFTLTASAAYQVVTFSVGSLALPAGDYVLFATTSRDQTGAPSSACRWGSVANTNIPNGQFVYLNNTADVSQWTGTTWSTIASDLAMQVNGLVTPVPAVPNTGLVFGFAVMLAVGFAGLVLRRRHAA